MCFDGLLNRRTGFPIEHILDKMDKRVRHRQPQPPDQLGEMLQHEWLTIPRYDVRNFIESMPRRCIAELAVRARY